MDHGRRTPAAVRATRHFADLPVTRADIEAIVDAARWTGSARNRQPWRFVSVTGHALRQRLATLGQYALPIATAPAALVLLSDSSAGRDTEFDLGRVCQSLVLAAHAAGLGSCPVSLYPEANAVAAARMAGYDLPWLANHAIALGHPAPAPAGRSAILSGRKPVSELLTHIGEHGPR
ncbi:nitroreductase family protein [Saccharomonospora sp. NPDC006951]